MATIYLPMNGYGFLLFIFISENESRNPTNHFLCARAEFLERKGLPLVNIPQAEHFACDVSFHPIDPNETRSERLRN